MRFEGTDSACESAVEFLSPTAALALRGMLGLSLPIRGSVPFAHIAHIGLS